MDLSNVQIGDEFLIAMSWGWSNSSDYYKKVYCESVTEKQCVIGGYKYRKRDGMAIGRSQYLQPFDIEKWMAGLKFLRRKNVENYKYSELPDEAIEDIYLIIKKSTEEKANETK